MASPNDEIPVDDVGDIGELVRAARKSQGLTQQEFADLVGVGVRFLSELERGKQTAEVGLVLRVIELAGYDVVFRRKGRFSGRQRVSSVEGDK